MYCPRVTNSLALCIRCVEVLLAAGVPRDAPTKHGGTALHSACGRGMSSCVRALLAARASTALRNGEGKSCLEKAAENGHLDIVRLLGQGFAAA
jgi:ankyrin repeat protein